MPDTKRSRPHQDRPATTTPLAGPASLPPTPDSLPSQRYPADSRPAQAHAIAARAQADQRIYDEGFRFGRQCGRAEGRAEGEAEADWRWIAALGEPRKAAESAGHDELVRRRADDCRQACPVHCGRCSRCIRADAVRRQGGDWPGGVA